MSVTIDMVMGFDFGIKKIGIAIGQKLTCTARPITVLLSKYGMPNWKYIKKIYEEWQPIILIVGLPLQLDGKKQPITDLAIQFATQLQNKFPKSIVKMHDERFSTSEARLYQNQNYYNNASSHAYKKHQIDAIAAEIILNSWLKTASLDE